MRNWTRIAIAGVILLGLMASFVYAQGGAAGRAGRAGTGRGGRMDGRAQMTPEQMKQMREQMMTMRLQRIGLTESELAAAKHALKTKEAAHTKLQAALQLLHVTIFTGDVTAKEAEEATATYSRALAALNGKVKAADDLLKSKLSAVSKARCLAMGILENGTGGMGMRFSPSAGRSGRGGDRMGSGGRRGMEAGPEAPKPAPNGGKIGE